jgi:hypothetical protein
VRLVLLLAAALSAVPMAAHALDKIEDRTFNGGPFDGIRYGPLVRIGNGVHVTGLKPSAPNAAPLPPALATLVEGLLKAYEAGDEANFRKYLTKGAEGEVCPQGIAGPCNKKPPLFTAHFAEICAHNTPYFMGRDQVRIEWLYKGELWYISYLDFQNGKVSRIRTLVAEMPPMVNAPSNSIAEATNG